MKKAVEVLTSGATPIPMEQAEARERLWTPDQAREEQDRDGREAGARREALDARRPPMTTRDERIRS